MATTEAKIQVARDTAANWTSNNPTLEAGEFGYETDTGSIKIGDGSTAWTGLAYTYDGVITFDKANNRVGINQPSPSEALDVGGNILAKVVSGAITLDIKTDDLSASVISVTSDADGTPRQGRFGMDYTNNVVRLNYGTAFTGTNNGLAINPSGQIGLGKAPNYQLELSTDSAGKPTTNTWTIVSDERIKDNIELADLNICYENIKNLPLKRYTWKFYDENEAPDRTMIGHIAQDVKNIFPKSCKAEKKKIKKEIKELIREAEIDAKGNIIQEAEYQIIQEAEYIDDCLDLNADQINKALFGAVQKLIEKVETLESKVKILEEI